MAVNRTPGSGPQTVVRYDKEQIAAFRKSLQDARTALQDARPAYRRAAAFLDRWVQLNFRTEGGKVGGWEPFAAGGRKRKGVLDTSAKLLQDTGALRLSFRPFATRTNAGIGSDIPYSEAHEEGKGVPQRRMLPKAAEVRADLRDILDQYVDHDILAPIRGALKEGTKRVKPR